MSAKAGKRPMRPLANQEKMDAIRRVHGGESKASVARDIGVPESTLRGWCKNEEKIALLLRQSSSPDTESSAESQHKKRKLDENVKPYNLSSKASTSRQNSYSPIPDRYNSPYDYSRTSSDPKLMPLDLKTRSNSTSPSENERNRAELARLSVQLGLNTPEKFNSTISNFANSNMATVANNLALLDHYNKLILQRNQIQQARNIVSPANAHSRSASAGNQSSEKRSPLRLPDETISAEDYVQYWVNNSTPPNLSPNSIPTTTTAVSTSLSTPVSVSGNSTNLTNDQQHAWLAKWYRSFITSQYGNVQCPTQIPQVNSEKPILYQELTKDKEVQNAENLSTSASLPEDRPGARNISNSKARAVLDNLLLNNNNITARRENNESEFLSLTEGVTHGEKFLKFLESCSGPHVTAVHLMQVRTLIDKVKTSAEVPDGNSSPRIKERRK